MSAKSEPVPQGVVGNYYGSHNKGSSGGTQTSHGGSLVGSNRSSQAFSGYTSGHTHSPVSSRTLSSEDTNAHTYTYHPRQEPRRPTRRDGIWPFRAGRTLDVAENSPGYLHQPRHLFFNPVIGAGVASAGMVLKGVGALGDAGKALMARGIFNFREIR